MDRHRLTTSTATVRGIAALMGVGFALQGIVWLVAPERAAASLGMPLLDGLARSTQIGDFAAFFLTLGFSTVAGIALGRPRLLYAPAALLGSAAAGRVIAWLVHGAAFAALFIAVEIAATLLLLIVIRRARSEHAAAPPSGRP